jgi:hypothetical protein
MPPVSANIVLRFQSFRTGFPDLPARQKALPMREL